MCVNLMFFVAYFCNCLENIMHIFLQSFFHSTHFIVIIDLACYCKTIDGLQLRHSFFPPKRHYKALDVTVNQRIIPSVGIFKEFDC